MRILALSLAFCLILSGPLAAFVQENNRAVKLLQEGRFVEGVKLLKQAREKQPYDETVRRNLRIAYAEAGRQLVQGRRFKEAVKLLEEAQGFDDSERSYWVLRGYALLRLQQYDEAEVELLEAQGMGEPEARIDYLLGQIYYDTDRMYEALDTLEAAASSAPDDHEITQMLEKVRRELSVEREMEKEYGGHFVISFEGGRNAAIGGQVLDALEEAYNWVGSRLDHYPEQRIPVILYSRRQFGELTDSPQWAGGLYDGKIRLPVGGMTSVDAPVRGLLYHEYMHVVVRDMTGGNVPTWLNEGLAEMAERQVVERALVALPDARQHDALLPLTTLEHSFGKFDGAQAALAYEQSYAVVRFLVEGYGWHMLHDLLLALGERLPIAQAVDRVFGIYDLDYRTLEERWRTAG